MTTNVQRIGSYLAKSAQLSTGATETKAAEIVGGSVANIVALLKAALASEWLAYYQYWLGAKVARGTQRAAIADELMAHAAEEFAHAGLLADRIVELGGSPVVAPSQWNSASPCKFDSPSDSSVMRIVEQNIAGERCAIAFYKKLLDATREADEVTYDMLIKIIKDEQEHETDLRKFIEDLKQGE